LIRDRVLLQAADRLHLVTTDERLDRLFKSDPQFEFLRNPDGSLNREQVNRLGLSSEAFAERLRQDISRRQLMAGIAESAMAPQAAATAALDAFFQQREVQIERIAAKDFLATSQPTDAEIDAFYKSPANAAMFLSPEEATVEYVVLDPETLKAGVTVSTPTSRPTTSRTRRATCRRRSVARATSSSRRTRMRRRRTARRPGPRPRACWRS
jgi:peptidyl-prolyl cis-trans isomerase D